MTLGNPALNAGVGVPFKANFATGEYTLRNGVSDFATMFGYARSGVALADDSAGFWQSFATNAARITNLGILLETAGENFVRNTELAGGAPGTPGTLPTNLARFVGGGLSHQIVSFPTDSVTGFACMEWRIFGTANASSGINLQFETTTNTPAVQSETFTGSFFVALVAGTLNGLNSVQIDTYELTAAGASAGATLFGSNFKASVTANLKRFSIAKAMAQATCAYTRHGLAMGFTNGAVIDATLRIAMPQQEKRSSASSPVDGPRAADALTLHLPAGPTRDLVITFDDNSTHVISDLPSGDYAIDPANLNRPRVKSVDWRSV
jgi:hypothetical protein